MSEVRLFRTLGVPLAIAFIFLVFTPKLCEKAIIDARKRQAVVAQTGSSPAPTGLVIQSSTPPPVTASSLHFPPGLDAARVQYLVEIDVAFAVPMMMTVTPESPITPILIERQYVDRNLAPTREGLINVNGAVQSPDGWSVPAAQRKFVSIDRVEDAGDNRYNVGIRWRWEPTAIATSLLPKPMEHHATAELAGTGGSWVLTRYVEPPDSGMR